MSSFFYLFLYTGLGLCLSPWIHRSSSVSVKFGESFFIGVLIIIVPLNLIQSFALFTSAKYFAYFLLLLSFGGWLLAWSEFRWKSFQSLQISPFKLIVLVIILFHIALIMYQNSHLPLIPWDAWYGWIAKAKIWFYHGLSEPLISRSEWATSDSGMTNPVHHYPDGLSLLYVFNGYFFSWNEPKLNGLYPAMFIALLMVIYGRLKQMSGSDYISLSAVLVFASLPLVNSHALLAGYADIWLSAYLFMSLVSMQQFLQHPTAKHLILSVIFLFAMILFKLEGWVWMMVALAAWIYSLISARKRWILTLVVLIVFITWYLLGGFHINTSFGTLAIQPELIEIPFMGSYKLSFVNTSSAWLESLFLSYNWNLLFYSLPFVMFFFVRLNNRSQVLLPAFFLIFSTGFLFLLFYMTLASVWANDFTSSNRILLHIIPVYIYFLLTCYQQYIKQKTQA